MNWHLQTKKPRRGGFPLKRVIPTCLFLECGCRLWWNVGLTARQRHLLDPLEVTGDLLWQRALCRHRLNRLFGRNVSALPAFLSSAKSFAFAVRFLRASICLEMLLFTSSNLRSRPSFFSSTLMMCQPNRVLTGFDTVPIFIAKALFQSRVPYDPWQA